MVLRISGSGFSLLKFAFCNRYLPVYVFNLDRLSRAARPANLQPINFCVAAETEVQS
jgi:hypothetical protein